MRFRELAVHGDLEPLIPGDYNAVLFVWIPLVVNIDHAHELHGASNEVLKADLPVVAIAKHQSLEHVLVYAVTRGLERLA